MSISVETLALAKKNTKQAVEEALTSVYTYRGSVETLNDLPTSGQKVGDVYNVVSEAGQNYAWDGSNWDALGIAENLGDIEFTDSEGNTKTINEDFWDAEKVRGQINNLSNGLNDVSNKTNYGIQKAADANNQANAAFNKANDVSNTANTAANIANNASNIANDAVNSLNDLGNVEFNNKKTITVNYPKAGNIYFDLNELDNNDVIEFYFPNREEITNYISNHPEVNGELLQIPMFGDTTVLTQKDIASTDIEQYLQRDADTEFVSIPVSKIKEWSDNKRFAIFPLRLFYKNSSNQIIRSNCYLNSLDNYITYSSNTRETISERYYEKQEIDDMLNGYNNNNLGNVEFESIKTKVQEQSFSIKQNIFNQSSAMFPNNKGQKIKITQDLDINKIQFNDDMEGYYYLGTVEVENFDEVYELRINDEYNVSTFAGHSNNQTLDNSYVLDTMPIFLYGSPTYRDFDMVVPVDFVTQYCPQNNINFLSFIDSCVGQNNTIVKLVNPVFNINYDALIKQTINQDYYDKEDVDNLISNAAPAAWQQVSTVTTNEATNSVTFPIDKNYDEYLITFNRPIVMDGPNPADSMTSNDGSLLLSIGGQTVIGSKLSIYKKMDGIYTVKRIIDNMYYGTGYHNGLMSNMKDYTENIVDINDASNGGVMLSTSASGSTANIASNVTITLYGKGGQETE